MKRVPGSTRLFAAAVVSVGFSLCLFGCSEKAPHAPPTPTAPPARARAAASGTVVGRVTYVGPVPKLTPHRLSVSLHQACGEEVEDTSLLVGADHGLANAVVAVADELPQAQAAGHPAPLLDQLRCRYEPPVIAARAGTSLKIKNSDALLHNVRAEAGRSNAFNVAMPLVQTIEKPLPANPTHLELKCDIHPWMRADLYTFEHDRFAVTAADGSFRIEGVEVGERPLTIVHPRLGTKAVTAQVRANETTTLDVSFEGSAP